MNRTSVALIIIFSVVALTVHARLWEAWDYSSLLFIQSLIPRSADVFFSVLSILGSFELSFLLLGLIAVVKLGRRHAVVLLAIFVAVVGVEWLGKHLIYQPGPPGSLLRNALRLSMPSSGVDTPFSFPSGHAARSAFFTVLAGTWLWATRFRGKYFALAFLLLAEVVMLLSRVSLAHHWPTDVIGGAFLGALGALVGLKIILDPR